jgi:hypothetical protein
VVLEEPVADDPVEEAVLESDVPVDAELEVAAPLDDVLEPELLDVFTVVAEVDAALLVWG